MKQVLRMDSKEAIRPCRFPALPVLIAFLLAAAVCVLGTPAQAHADDIDTVRAQLEASQAELDRASDAYYEAMNRHDEATEEMNQAQAAYEAAEAQKASLQGRLGTRAKSMYRTGASTFLDVLLGADSFDDFVTTWDTLNALNKEDQQYVAQTKELSRQAQEARAVAEEKREVAEEAMAEAEAARAQAEALVAANTERLNTLNSEQQATLLERTVNEMQSNGMSEDEIVAAIQNGAAGPAAAAAVSDAVSAGGGGGSSSSSSGSSSRISGSSILDRAYASLGASYVWGASSSSAFDCSGLVSYAYTGSYGHAYTSSSLSRFSAVSDPQPGDVCVTEGGGHCGIYVGDGQMIHAATEGVGVIQSDVQSNMKIVRPN